MNRYMPKPYRCNLCFRTFNTFTQAEAHWFDVHAHTAIAMEAQRGATGNTVAPAEGADSAGLEEASPSPDRHTPEPKQ